jgi:hypothetical protein
MASSSAGVVANEMDQLLRLQRQGILSATDFARMASEIHKTDEERFSEAVEADKKSEDSGVQDLVDEDGLPYLPFAEGSPLDALGGVSDDHVSFDDEQDEDLVDEDLEPATPSHEDISEDGPDKWPLRSAVICSSLDSNAVEDVHFLRMGNASDFINNGRAYIEFQMLKKGCVRKYETHKRWVMSNTLSRPPGAEITSSPIASPARQLPGIEERSPAPSARRPGHETGNDTLPELAGHERARKMIQKTQATGKFGKGTERGVGGSHKTEPTKLPLEMRVQSFPVQSLTVAITPNGKVLFCRCCPKKIENILGTIKTRVGSDMHKEKLVNWMERNKTDAEVKEFLQQYFQQYPALVPCWLCKDRAASRCAAYNKTTHGWGRARCIYQHHPWYHLRCADNRCGLWRARFVLD